MSMAMTLLSACADNNLGTDTERESVILKILRRTSI